MDGWMDGWVDGCTYDMAGWLAGWLSICRLCRLSVVKNSQPASYPSALRQLGQAVNINNITTAVRPSVSVNSPLGPPLRVSRVELID